MINKIIFLKNIKAFKTFLSRKLELTFFYKYLFFFKKKGLEKIKIIYLPSIEYHFPLFQRPQYLALELSKIKEIFFIYLQASSVYSKCRALEKINDNLYLSKLFRTVPYFVKNSWIMLISGQAITTIYDLKKYKKIGQKIIYDYVDEISIDICGDEKAYRFLKERHEIIKKEKLADLVICTSKILYQEMANYYPKDKLILVSNGVDYDLFHKKPDFKEIPKAMINIINQKKPIIGYHGAIAPWLDFELINNTALKNPQYNFVFIGLNYQNALKNLNFKLKNIFYIPEVPFNDLSKYSSFFDIAIIPFKKGRIAQTTSPLKVYEYMALNKLVVATEDMLELYNLDGIFITKNQVADFEKKIKKALNLKNNQNLIKKIDAYAKKNSWFERAKIIYKKLKELSYAD